MTKKTGIWFYGLSGTGKTYGSNLLHKKIKNSILIDGDIVRKYVSYDLDYTENDRNIQITRMYGLAKIAINSNIFPIISTVWMNNKMLKKASNLGIKVILIKSEMNEVKKDHNTYKNKKNVVGVNFDYEKKLNTLIITNTKDKEFWNLLKTLI